jgi:hypothetical protein
METIGGCAVTGRVSWELDRRMMSGLISRLRGTVALWPTSDEWTGVAGARGFNSVSDQFGKQRNEWNLLQQYKTDEVENANHPLTVHGAGWAAPSLPHSPSS